MVNDSPFYEPGQEPPPNGNSYFHRPAHWSHSIINKRPKAVSAKKIVVFLSIDIMAFFAIAGIVDKLTTTKEVIALFVAIAYLVVRLAIGVVKLFAFVGRNKEGIQKGWKSIKDLFKE